MNHPASKKNKEITLKTYIYSQFLVPSSGQAPWGLLPNKGQGGKSQKFRRYRNYISENKRY